ncbi:FHA domain-containing protein [Clostridium sp. E02]|uniref:FHA domain-containing protein n=1 Tax=Clostridium sp. E02 TaxID=2487134 RepID=UPI000F539642|nr:FHA domain-containing protein [Clostridium sp. E02]
MSLVRCPNGHVYNARRYGNTCPYCQMKLKEEAGENKPLGFEPAMELLQEEINPVCGWIVCISGARVGMDYKIHSGKNFVGRGDEMDIQILGDNDINRKNHTIIVYDQKKRNMVILPGDAAGLAYLNEEAIYVPTELKPYDVIELGKSRFLFIPLCGENFEWNDQK